ncbi:MAG: DEAD/DEAH box helicase family protein, partial [Firmicutes bacterium]|nr:DEAD/DEAH box helicase family protein [Bacillota bacterium]
SVLTARLAQESESYSDYTNEITLPDMAQIYRELDDFTNGIVSLSEFSDCYEFMIRYLFSCLTDADFLDTEAFCSGTERAPHVTDWNSALSATEEKLASFQHKTELQKARALLQKQAKENILLDSSVYLLNMPTGSGKTLCSLLLALIRLCKIQKKRIIYVIPYTSILVRTAITR